MRILLSEGSGLTSRQVATRLGELGHEVEILSSSPLCLTRFTRHVRKVHPVPRFGVEPFAWLAAAVQIVKAREMDVLFPTQEQVAVLSARAEMLDIPTIVPPFRSLRRVQDKISACRTLGEIGLPQPASLIVNDADDLRAVEGFPVFVKRPVGTASGGVLRAGSRAELEIATRALGLGKSELLIQSESKGPLAMVQAVADHGRLIAHHANLRLLEGVGGGAALKESVVLPQTVAHLERIVSTLDWHGALSMDVIVTEDGPMVIDVNPRLVEPMNAYLSGVDLVEAMLALTRNEHPPEQPMGMPGVRSRQLLLALLGAAQHEGTRKAVVRVLIQVLWQRGEYAGAKEELTPIAGDPIATLPVIAASIAALARPQLWRFFHNAGVGPYALTPEAWDEIILAVGT